MDFDRAADRLARDQQKLRSRQQQRGAPKLSAAAQRQAAQRQRQEAARREARAKQQARTAALQTLKARALRQYGGVRSTLVKESSSNNSPNALSLAATSIHGQGDKIALPPSVLEYLTAVANIESSPDAPWIFRLAVPNPDHTFPASSLWQALVEEELREEDTEESDDDEDDDDNRLQAAWRDELLHQYLSYTHASVVEFTQDEGHVGLPAAVAAALLRHDGVARHRTVDPSGNNNTEIMNDDNDQGEPTTGHPAYGAFDVPAVPLEISLVTLPRGQACTLQPTAEAVQHGFYNLADIKLVLTQSLQRTRATLSVTDVVHTWHRGRRYDLTVVQVTPSDHQAIVCINTDLTVDFAAVEDEDKAAPADTSQSAPDTGHTLGRTLGSATAEPSQTNVQPSPPTAPSINLRPEPPADQTENVCLVQVRHADGTSGRRRFDVTAATVADLLAFAQSLNPSSTLAFRLVARFPRRILDTTMQNQTLTEAGVKAGQEMFLMEML